MPREKLPEKERIERKRASRRRSYHKHNEKEKKRMRDRYHMNKDAERARNIKYKKRFFERSLRYIGKIICYVCGKPGYLYESIEVNKKTGTISIHYRVKHQGKRENGKRKVWSCYPKEI